MKLLSICALCACVGVCAGSALHPLASPTPCDVNYPVAVAGLASEAGRKHDPLGMVLDIAGVKHPDLVAASELQLNSDEEVIGVEFQGKAFAFVKRGMHDPTTHIANLLVDGKPLSVTYCSMAQCARVVTADERDEPLDLRVGGLDIHSQMVLLFEEQRFGQASMQLPLNDQPFQQMTLGEWTKRHPSTSVYLGDVQLEYGSGASM